MKVIKFVFNDKSLIIVLLILSFSSFSQNNLQVEKAAYNSILEELKDTPFWFIDSSEEEKSKVNEYYKFDGIYVFEHYVLWRNDDCYWVGFADSDNYSVRKNTKTELIIIYSTGGDNFWEIRFVKRDSEFFYASNEYLNGELVRPENPLMKMIKAKNTPLKICKK